MKKLTINLCIASLLGALFIPLAAAAVVKGVGPMSWVSGPFVGVGGKGLPGIKFVTYGDRELTNKFYVTDIIPGGPSVSYIISPRSMMYPACEFKVSISDDGRTPTITPSSQTIDVTFGDSKYKGKYKMTCVVDSSDRMNPKITATMTKR